MYSHTQEAVALIECIGTTGCGCNDVGMYRRATAWLTEEHNMAVHETIAAEYKELREFIRREGFVKCDIPACNCGAYHKPRTTPTKGHE